MLYLLGNERRQDLYQTGRGHVPIGNLPEVWLPMPVFLSVLPARLLFGLGAEPYDSSGFARYERELTNKQEFSDRLLAGQADGDYSVVSATTRLIPSVIDMGLLVETATFCSAFYS